MILCRRGAIRITQISDKNAPQKEDYFRITVDDPSENAALKSQILSNLDQFSYLKAIDPSRREMLVGLYVQVKIMEKFFVQILDQSSIKKIDLGSDSQD
jgi:uncharacterized protein YlbG (UPF0298 family)